MGGGGTGLGVTPGLGQMNPQPAALGQPGPAAMPGWGQRTNEYGKKYGWFQQAALGQPGPPPQQQNDVLAKSVQGWGQHVNAQGDPYGWFKLQEGQNQNVFNPPPQGQQDFGNAIKRLLGGMG